MKKLLSILMPVKSFAAMIFTGLMILYMMTGALYAAATGTAFTYVIPFVFVLQGVCLAILIAVFWSLLFNEWLDKKMRWFPRFIIFALSLLGLLAVCLLVFRAVPTAWAKLWLLAAGIVVAGIALISIGSEIYLRHAGKRYTEILKEYQAGKNLIR